MGQQSRRSGGGHRREHVPPASLTPRAYARHHERDQHREHGGNGDRHQNYVGDELVVRRGCGPRCGERHTAEGVGREDHPGDRRQRPQREPGREPRREALAGQLGQSPDEGHRGRQPGADLHGPEHRRVEALVVTQRLRSQGDREACSRARPGGLIEPGQAGEPPHQHPGDDGRDDGGCARCQERNRHCCLWCPTTADDAAQMADQAGQDPAAGSMRSL